MQADSISSMRGATGGAEFKSISAEPTQGQQQTFENLLSRADQGGGSQLEKTLNSIEDRFNSKHVEIVNSIKKFEATGSAVSLMVASHEGANKSVMVQLCGTIGKKCSDNVEQLYKQQ